MKYYKKIIKDAFLQISRHKMKSFMTLLAVAIANLTILLVVSSNSYMDRQLNSQLGKKSPISVTYDAGNRYKNSGFTISDAKQIENITGVTKVSLQDQGLSRQLPVKIRDQQTQKTIRSINEVRKNSDISIIKGNIQSIFSNRNNILISDEMANQIKLKRQSNNVIGNHLSINNHRFKISGIFYTTSDPTILPDIIISNSAENTLKSKNFDSMLVYHRHDSSSLVPKISNKLAEKGSNRRDGRYSIINNSKALQESQNEAKSSKVMFLTISFVALFVAGFGVMNSLYASISERYQEIAIRRAIGAKKSTIQLSFQIEGTLLTTIGGVLGISLAICISIIGKSSGIQINISPSSICLSMTVTIIIGLIFSYFPALKASTQNVIEGLND